MNRLLPACALALSLASTIAAATPDRMEEGRKAYEAVCAKCHNTGIMGAPTFGSPDDWQERSELWEGVLFEHANQGWINMPAKGGDPSMSEYDVDAAAEYLLTKSHPKLLAD